MKKNLSIFLLILLTLLLTSCGPKRNPVLDSYLVQEAWMQKVDKSPTKWAFGASSWFLNGGPSVMQPRFTVMFPFMAPTTMEVTVTPFSSVQVVGNFQVQISGAYEPNSVYLFGPNNAIRSIIIQVKGNILCVSQAEKAPGNVSDVVVRIGMSQISQLTHYGSGQIEGVKLCSSNLSVTSGGSGNIYLSGNLDVRNIISQSTGAVTIFGANSTSLNITTMGAGAVNLSGDMSVNSIVHHGSGDINLIGAHSDNLTIYASGSGKVGIKGNGINLTRLTAKGSTCVFLYSINSNGVYVNVSNNARVGIEGCASTLYVDTSNSAVFRGRYLCVRDAYVRACDSSHINVAGMDRIFATATQSGSIYYFGTPNTLTQFVTGSGVIIPVWSKSCMISPVAVSKKITVKRVRVMKPVKKTHQIKHFVGEG